MMGIGLPNGYLDQTTPREFATVVSLVLREAAEECPPDHRLAAELDACVHQTVADLWPSRIKIYVPLLALRRVRCCLRTGSCDCEEC
jgi:hypothetical protein